MIGLEHAGLAISIVMAINIAIIAKSKNRDEVAWGFYGFFLWPIALTHILVKEKLPALTAAPNKAAEANKDDWASSFDEGRARLQAYHQSRSDQARATLKSLT